VAWRRFSRVVVAILLMAGLGGGSVAAADDAQPPALTVQAVSIIWPDGDTVSTPSVQIPGGGQSSVSDWGSSADQPVVEAGTVSSSASVTRKAMTGDVQLDELSLFGGEATLASMSFAASHSTRVNGSDFAADQLVIDGAPVSVPAAGAAPVAIGEWGQMTSDVTLRDAAGSTVIGLRIEVLADHGGLPAGSEIRLGVVSWPPAAAQGDQQQSVQAPPTIKQQPGSHGSHHQAPKRSGHRHPPRVVHPSHLPRLGHGARARVVRAAAAQLGWPYLWGGESRAEGGFDCSGLVDYAYAAAGHPFPGRPTAAVLWRMGIPIARDHLRPGDLTFLGAPSGDPYHVGLYAGGGVVIVASGRGEPIAAVPLDSVPWDGFARVWAAGSSKPLRAGWLTAAARVTRLRVGLRADAIVAGSEAGSRVSPPPSHDTGRVAPGKRPAPRKPGRQTPSAATIADVRLRGAPGRPIGPLPSA
jgi:cell wall-associated NlpC family hydrolase